MKKRIFVYMIGFVLISTFSVYGNAPEDELLEEKVVERKENDNLKSVCDDLDELIISQEVDLKNTELADEDEPEIEPEMLELIEKRIENNRNEEVQANHRANISEVEQDAGLMSKNVKSYDRNEVKKVFSIRDNDFIYKITHGEDIYHFFDENEYMIYVPMKNENNINATMQLGYSEEVQEWEPRGITFCSSGEALLLEDKEIVQGFEEVLQEGDTLKEVKYFNTWLQGPFVLAYVETTTGDEWLMPIDEGASAYSLDRNKAYSFEEFVEKLEFLL